MTDRNKFEEMLERLVNEDREGAEELFHEIVVEKSREIYQNIIEAEDEEVDEAEDDDLDESDDEDLDENEDDDLDESDDEDLDESVEDEEVDESEDDDLDEMFGLDEFETEADPMGGDATDDMMGDLEMGGDEEGEEEGEEGGEGPEAALDNLEDALEALKAEFEQLMGSDDDGDGDEEGDDEGDMDMDMGGDEEGEEEPEEESFQATITPLETKSAKLSAGEQMREYVEKVSASMGDNGANTQSIVAKPNNMGGTTANIAKSGTEAGTEANKGQLKGNGLLKGTPKPMNTKNVNVPGAKGATKMSNQPGHGAEKKGKPETTDKSAGSMLNGAPKRAK